MGAENDEPGPRTGADNVARLNGCDAVGDQLWLSGERFCDATRQIRQGSMMMRNGSRGKFVRPCKGGRFKCRPKHG